jgi:hypothetical protein
MSALEAALAFARRGWAVVPIWPPVPGGCSCPKGATCKSPGKHPATSHGYDSASKDEAGIHRMFAGRDDYGVGVATGPASNLLVLDVDKKHGGEETLKKIFTAEHPMPQTPVVATGGGGVHIYLKLPPGVEKFPLDLGPGVEVKVAKRGVVAPPSLHASGQRYSWDAFEGLTPAEAPDWLLSIITAAAKKKQKPRTGASGPTDPATSDAKRLQPITAKTIIETDYPALRFIVARLVVEGLMLLAGRPKIGKSWLALMLALAVVSGGKFLGHDVTDRAEVLYCALEDSPRRIKKRLAVLGASSAPENLHFLFELPKLDVGGANALDAWLAAHECVRLVIVDVFNRIRGAKAKGVEPYQHDAAEMAKLQVVAQRRGVTIVVLTHDRKAGAEDWLERITGTLGVAGTADTVALLERDRQAVNGRLRVVGRDLEDELDLGLEFAGGRWSPLGPGEVLDLSLERQKIVAGIPTSGEGLSPTQIEKATGVSVNTIKHALPALIKDGWVRLIGTGRYLRCASDTPHTPYTEALFP